MLTVVRNAAFWAHEGSSQRAQVHRIGLETQYKEPACPLLSFSVRTTGLDFSCPAHQLKFSSRGLLSVPSPARVRQVAGTGLFSDGTLSLECCHL